MSKPHILFVSHTGSLGGAELSMLEIAEHFRDRATFLLFEDGPFRERLQHRGVSVEVVQASSRLMDVEREADVLDVTMAIPEAIRLTARVGQIARCHDLIYAASQKALVVGSLAGFFADRPVVWHLHDILNTDHFSDLNRFASVQLANWLVERVFVNSKPTKSAFASSGGDADQARVIHYGIDPAPFDRVEDRVVEELRHDLVPPDVPLVGVFSRLTEWKGQHVLVQALPSLPDVHALLVGDAPFDNGATYKQDLNALAREQNVRDRVHFLGFREDIPQLMKAVDVVLHTSTAPEPFGRVIVEGMLAEQPVVATRAGGAKQIVDHEETGLLVPPGDETAMARAVNRLLDNPEFAESLGSRGYRYATMEFSPERMNKKITASVRDLLRK